MKIMDGYSVIVDDDPSRVAIVEGREGQVLRLRFARDGTPFRERMDRDAVKAVAEVLAVKMHSNKKYSNLSFAGKSTLAELAGAFGYKAEARLRFDTFQSIRHQLMRAGLRLVLQDDDASYDAPFRLDIIDKEPPTSGTLGVATSAKTAGLPSIFWPEALGIGRTDELRLLRALTQNEPILCLLDVSTQEGRHPWLQSTWEGLLVWAYTSAQRFVRWTERPPENQIVIAPAANLQQYLRPGTLARELHLLNDSSRHLNLVTLAKNTDERELVRLQARWPGVMFRFAPKWLENRTEGVPDEVRALIQLFCLVGGRPSGVPEQAMPDMSPLNLLVWAREACQQIQAGTSATVAALVATSKDERYDHFRGSSEAGTALALKALTAMSLKRNHPAIKLSFEQYVDSVDGEDGEDAAMVRVDIEAKGVGTFEIESMLGSGPIECFSARKVYRRKLATEPLHLVVPGDALLWAGPYLADIAARLGERGGGVRVPLVRDAKDQSTFDLVQLEGRVLDGAVDIEEPAAAGIANGPEPSKTELESPLKLKDIAGYEEIQQSVRENVIWPRHNHRLMRGCSRTAGILFYGPPGCGKSRLARAICGELAQEVRLLAPSDLRGLYIGWGQILIREQFDWLFESTDRVLLFDEFDAIARSRENDGMHSDEKADVNELLVQFDRAGRLGRMVLCTTNFVSSLDSALLRSGRFSDYVPMGPPDARACASIISYYLDRLGRDSNGVLVEGLRLTLPQREDVAGLLCQVIAEQKPEDGWLCGADLEAAVNAAYRTRVRRAQEGGASDARDLTVTVTLDDLAGAISNSRRSITRDTIERFLEDLRVYSPHLLDTYQRMLAAPRRERRDTLKDRA